MSPVTVVVYVVDDVPAATATEETRNARGSCSRRASRSCVASYGACTETVTVWRATPSLTINYGLRYDYYTPLAERDNLIVKFNIDTGVIDPNTTPLYASRKNNFQPRLALTYGEDRVRRVTIADPDAPLPEDRWAWRSVGLGEGPAG